MPSMTLTSQRQVAWLRETYPDSARYSSWRVGWMQNFNSYCCTRLAALASAKLEKWWEVDVLPLPGV